PLKAYMCDGMGTPCPQAGILQTSVLMVRTLGLKRKANMGSQLVGILLQFG
ncbi:Hypothetical predicted protein, partial [Olea europaea subsp. europaea]